MSVYTTIFSLDVDVAAGIEDVRLSVTGDGQEGIVLLSPLEAIRIASALNEAAETVRNRRGRGIA